MIERYVAWRESPLLEQGLKNACLREKIYNVIIAADLIHHTWQRDTLLRYANESEDRRLFTALRRG